ncbi:hypothetical protein [Sporosarcina sp. Te-1]|uniref:hypothetical protein n=1 Tax=Sporosarcina sp. Te-1 TaxID=2818390 RepID=UPI001A9D01D4|nr:hypothetical protein [Sporosarcina sp. Te-1]QTD40374.1 hypothetical protein J3U78_16555 [Sporosarcina sp. Te-1]
MKTKLFLFGFVFVYVWISLPLGMGYHVSWALEATLWQKFKWYIITGLSENYALKLVLSSISMVIYNFLFKRYKHKKIAVCPLRFRVQNK